MKARSDELQIFVSVIECGSISAAAEQVGYTPSAVSRTLSRLEAKLDTTLINRTTRRMDLTEEGKYFFEQAKVILAQMDEGVWGAMEPKTNVSPTTFARSPLPRHPPR